MILNQLYSSVKIAKLGAKETLSVSCDTAKHHEITQICMLYTTLGIEHAKIVAAPIAVTGESALAGTLFLEQNGLRFQMKQRACAGT